MCQPSFRGARFSRVGWLAGAWLVLVPLLARPAAAERPVLTTDSLTDPYCQVTNAATTAVARPLPASTRRMIERLAKIREAANPGSMAYLNDRMIPVLRRQLSETVDARHRISLRFDLGRQMLYAGHPLDALREFDGIDQTLADLGLQLTGLRASQAQLNRAVALLRLGEQENCITNHHADSCLFPIEGGGIHRLQRGSRGAIQVLTELLKSAPGDLQARWLLNLAYMTLGEWPAQVPPTWVIGPEVFRSQYDIGRFPDVAGSLGVDVDDLAGGCILDDFDNDGFIDLVASSWSLTGQLRYFRQSGDGRFVERTAEAGLLGMVSGLNIQQTDYNNDGWLDLWILRGAWLGPAGRIPNSLLRNNRDGTFTDVTEEAGLLSAHPTQASTWFDYDGDGWLDVFIGNESWDRADPDLSELYHNNRDGTFTECARMSGIGVAAIVKGVTSGDYDNDGRPDLYLSCRNRPNLLFRNEGAGGTNAAGEVTWRFRNVTSEAGLNDLVYSFPTWFFDYDNDGDEDLFVSGYMIRDVGDVAADYLGLPHQGAKARLYRNLGDGRFENVTRAAGLDRICHTMGSNFGDLDNDGWLDFYLGTGDPDFATLIPNRMFRNSGGRSFQEVTTSGGFGHLQKGHGVGFADLDHDGDQDIYQVVGGAFVGDRYPNALFLNPGHGNRWLKLHCVGQRSNRAAIGTRIKVTVQTPEGQRSIYKTVSSGGSFGSSPLRQEIGLGQATSILKVELHWPATGIRQEFTDLQPNRAYRLVEGVDQAVPLRLPTLRFDTSAPPAHLHLAGPKLPL